MQASTLSLRNGRKKIQAYIILTVNRRQPGFPGCRPTDVTDLKRLDFSRTTGLEPYYLSSASDSELASSPNTFSGYFVDCNPDLLTSLQWI